MDQRTAAGGYSGKQYNYTVVTNGTPVNPDVFEDMGVAKDDIHYDAANYAYVELPLTAENARRMRSMGNVTAIIKREGEGADPDIFPQSENYPWNVDNFGPLWIPSKGDGRSDRREPAAVPADHRNLRRE